ncbi:MAG: hypothetical protein WCX70_01620 [Candidatus Paceibacterota bacterium]|jgi:hypothetical protein
MKNKKEYQSGEQMDLPEIEERGQDLDLDTKFEETREDDKISKLAKDYIQSRTPEDELRDRCPICGGSGNYCPACIRNGLIPDPQKTKEVK